MYKIYKEENITDGLINLYIDCFKKDRIFLSRDKQTISDINVINYIFNIYLKYGCILTMRFRNSKIAFLCAIDIEKITSDKDAYNFMFDKEKYPEIYKFINQNNNTGYYIVLTGVNKKFRRKGLATKIIKHYLHYYHKYNFVFSDIDNDNTLKIFKKLKFNIIKQNKDYYIVYRGKDENK